MNITIDELIFRLLQQMQQETAPDEKRREQNLENLLQQIDKEDNENG